MLTTKTTGIKRVISHCKKTQEGLKNMRPTYMKATVVVEQWIKRNIIAHGKNHDEGRYKWPPLSQNTIDYKRRHGAKTSNADQPLRDTGNLMMRWDLSATNKKGIVKSGVRYSWRHEAGKGVPQRKIFPAKKQEGDIVKPVFEKYMEKITRW